jgi:hypothetical protein
MQSSQSMPNCRGLSGGDYAIAWGGGVKGGCVREPTTIGCRSSIKRRGSAQTTLGPEPTMPVLDPPAQETVTPHCGLGQWSHEEADAATTTADSAWERPCSAWRRQCERVSPRSCTARPTQNAASNTRALATCPKRGTGRRVTGMFET